MNKIYASVQNGVILDVFPTFEEAKAKVNEEIRRDWIDIMLKKKLRKLLKKKDNFSLHKYQVFTIEAIEEVSE